MKLDFIKSVQPFSSIEVVNVLKEKPLQANQVGFVTAQKIQQSLNSGGRVALYGALSRL